MSNKFNEFNPSNSYLQERIRQAKLAFNLLLGATVLSGIGSFAGVGLLLSKQVSEGTTTSVGGLISNVAFAKMAKDSNDRLDKAMKEEEEENKDKAQ